MKLPHFLSSYLKQSRELLQAHDETRAMSLAVGGDFEAVGVVEFCLLKQWGLRPGHRLIDVGCGSGRLAAQLASYLQSGYLGLDVVPELLDYARRVCAREDWTFRLAPGTHIGEPDASADFIVFFSVFTHLHHEETYRYLRDAARVLRPGGTLVFSFLEFRVPSHWAVFESSVNDEREEKVLNQFLDRDLIGAFARSLNLVIVTLQDGDLAHIPLDRSVVWDDGREMSGLGSLGQSVCVLRHQLRRET
ncbi:class I SAM-dependent methyltransferase [Lysobacter enzymogenes]|uniref:class I SAM-dependent methyltransferase n=1 Tax=Lysobacter enzymogenes TaxID=69 RepID=UPI0008982B2B|nr:class I SAM-dependent methyltransferase [Lysobacter enzymogenes]SDW35082.1 Methyltransferase domain-containing protein [Lysobacter enzymogenes]